MAETGCTRFFWGTTRLQSNTFIQSSAVSSLHSLFLVCLSFKLYSYICFILVNYLSSHTNAFAVVVVSGVSTVTATLTTLQCICIMIYVMHSLFTYALLCAQLSFSEHTLTIVCLSHIMWNYVNWLSVATCVRVHGFGLMCCHETLMPHHVTALRHWEHLSLHS